MGIYLEKMHPENEGRHEVEEDVFSQSTAKKASDW